MKFKELDLKPEILKALEAMGYTDLTPVQEETFPHVLQDRDLLALAETGSGKTSACGIPLIQRIDPSHNSPQALILVPTRELALQYVEEIGQIAHYLDISPFAVFGGFDMDVQRAKLRDGVHILVATPGRLIDHLYNSELSLRDIKTLVLDEADEMLNMGFVDDIKFIMSCITVEHQTLLFSATMAKDIEDLATSYLRDPVKIELNRDRVAPQRLSHHFKFVSPRERLQAVKNYMAEQAVRQALIFCNSRRNGESLFEELRKDFASLEYIHGGLDQSRRISIFNRFKNGQITVLLATDVAARGLDFTRVTHVINYDFPSSVETYTNRTGRTGRMGKVGTALTLVNRRDLEALRRLLQTNRIQPVWHGEPPNLDQQAPRRDSRARRGGAPRRRPSTGRGGPQRRGRPRNG
jgi:ATP-dependent RNA helicase DeaD